jgi:hypothetical protein
MEYDVGPRYPQAAGYRAEYYQAPPMMYPPAPPATYAAVVPAMTYQFASPVERQAAWNGRYGPPMYQ